MQHRQQRRLRTGRSRGRQQAGPQPIINQHERAASAQRGRLGCYCLQRLPQLRRPPAAAHHEYRVRRGLLGRCRLPQQAGQQE